jgi:hypothetical protein
MHIAQRLESADFKAVSSNTFLAQSGLPGTFIVIAFLVAVRWGRCTVTIFGTDCTSVKSAFINVAALRREIAIRTPT